MRVQVLIVMVQELSYKDESREILDQQVNVVPTAQDFQNIMSNLVWDTGDYL